MSPRTRAAKGTHTPVGSSSASVISGDLGAGCGWPWAALSRCPGLPRQTSTRATTEGSGDRDGSQGGGRQKSGGRGTLPPTPTPSRVWADAAGGGLLRINEPCDFSGPGFTVAAPGHPSPPLRSSAPNSPGWATVSARLGAQKRFGAEAASSRSKRVWVISGWGINSIPSVAGSELRQLRDCRRRRCLCSAAGDIGRRPLETCRGGGRGAGRVGAGGESSNRARGRVSSGRGSGAGDNFSGARAAGRATGERGGSPAEPRPVPCAASALLAASGFAAPGAEALVYK